MKKTARGALYDVCTGEKLTEYLFDEVDKGLVGDKYSIVTVAGKKGLYNVETQKYVLLCEYAKIGGYHKFNDEEFVIVAKAGKEGIYNISKNKLIVTALNDDIDMRGGYARIRRSGKYAVYSLEYNKMVFESPVEYVELMNDGYALLQGPGMYEKGVYNLNWNEWYIDPMPGHDMCFLGGDYVGVANRGVGNYKTNKLLLRNDAEWAESYSEVIENIVVMGDPIEGAAMWIHKLDDPNFYLAASSIEVLAGSNTSMSGKTLAITHDFQYGEGWEILSVLSCRLQDLDSGRLIVADSFDGYKFTQMEYIDPGLVCVTMKTGQMWLFDIYTERWILRSSGKMSTHTDKYLIITLENGDEYLFDQSNRSITQIKENFSVRDYEILKGTRALVQNSVTSGYDRVSPMYN
jgi:hypothetical protein